MEKVKVKGSGAVCKLGFKTGNLKPTGKNASEWVSFEIHLQRDCGNTDEEIRENYDDIRDELENQFKIWLEKEGLIPDDEDDDVVNEKPSEIME